jgi:hypothetical protein
MQMDDLQRVMAGYTFCNVPVDLAGGKTTA